MSERLCVIGDSITGGVIYNDENSRYVKCRSSFMNLLAEELELDVRNHSRFGCTSTAALERLSRYESCIAESGYTLVMLGGNDCDFDWVSVAAAPEAKHECNTPAGRFLANYTLLLDRITALGGRPVVMNLIPVFGRRYFDWITRRAEPGGVMRFLGTTDSIEHWNEMYNLLVMRAAASRGVPVLDARSAFLYERVFDPFFSTDGIHPNELGHRRLFEHLLPQFRQLLDPPCALKTA